MKTVLQKSLMILSMMLVVALPQPSQADVTNDVQDLLSQANAARYGRSDYAETAFITPVLPELPARRTSFADFKNPVFTGQIPDRSYPHRLGPYDRLFKWRNYHYNNKHLHKRKTHFVLVTFHIFIQHLIS